MGDAVIVTAFIIIIVGGIGSLESDLAAIVYALVDTAVTTVFDGVVASIVGLLLMLVVLIVRPTGLFGRRNVPQRRGFGCGTRIAAALLAATGLIVLPHLLSFSQRNCSSSW